VARNPCFPKYLFISIKKLFNIELKDNYKQNFLYLFLTNLEDEIIFKGGRICNTLKSYFGIWEKFTKDLQFKSVFLISLSIEIFF
jgi:predicted nucleotidyltransferase component of viral defense system